MGKTAEEARLLRREGRREARPPAAPSTRAYAAQSAKAPREGWQRVDSCRDCPSCRNGEEQYCGQGMVGTYNDRERHKDGAPTRTRDR